jgi:uncharacterized membrane protein
MKRKFSKEEVWQWMNDNNKTFIYANKDDSNILIRKRYGISWNMNFGNPWTWCMICGMIFILSIAIYIIK